MTEAPASWCTPAWAFYVPVGSPDPTEDKDNIIPPDLGMRMHSYEPGGHKIFTQAEACGYHFIEFSDTILL